MDPVWSLSFKELAKIQSSTSLIKDGRIPEKSQRSQARLTLEKRDTVLASMLGRFL
jgi:hypothetical protein